MITTSATIRPAHEIATGTPHVERDSAYMTDGVRLYRFLGAIDTRGLGSAAIEDCHSLEIILVPLADLRDPSLRPVLPTEGCRAGAGKGGVAGRSATSAAAAVLDKHAA